MDQKCTNDMRFKYNKNLDQNLAWLNQKTEVPKSNKRNLTFPSHTVNMIELESNKKWQPPISTSSPPPPPPLQVYPSFLVKDFVPPPNDSIFGRFYPPL